jgi:glycosyltransferase involved in cell wall biosynthesis
MKKNIVFVIDSFVLGGAERQASMLAIYLKNTNRYNVTVLAISKNENEGKLEQFFTENHVVFDHVKFSFFSNHIFRILNLLLFVFRLRKYKPTAILPFTIRPNVACSAIWQLTGADICIWSQQDLGLGFSEKYRDKILWWSLKNTPLFVSNSIGGKKVLEDYFPKHAPIKVILNGSSLKSNESSKSYWCDRLKISEEKYLAIKVANLTSNKDHFTLIKTWNVLRSLLNDDNQMPILIFAGYYGDKFAEIEDLIKEYKLDKLILIPGAIEDISGLISSSDLCLFSSVSEGIPNGILECMAAKLPVISTNISGAKEALGEDYRYFVEIGDFNEYAKLVLFFMKNKDIGKEIGHLNYLRVKSLFDYENMYNEYEYLINHYENIV